MPSGSLCSTDSVYYKAHINLKSGFLVCPLSFERITYKVPGQCFGPPVCRSENSRSESSGASGSTLSLPWPRAGTGSGDRMSLRRTAVWFVQ